MTIKIHRLVQGTPEWHAFRASHHGASEASAMMGASPYMSRTQLLNQKKTGVVPEVDESTQRRFDDGHRAEAAARPIIEEQIGVELFPVTVSSLALSNWSASLDGRTLDGFVIWEHKLWNESKAADVRAGKIPDCDFWQVVHQLCVSEADRCVYTVSDGTAEKMVSCEYKLKAADAQALAAGWQQFDADLETHEVAEPEPVHETQSAGVLPTLRIEVQGKVLASNVDAFRTSAHEIITAINRDLNTDDDFAQAEADVKWCKDVEAKLEAKEQAVMAQTADIATVIDVVREVKEAARQTRLVLEKLVKERKQALKVNIAMDAKASIDAHCEKLAASLPPGYTLPLPSYSINDAMKGKKTISSLRDAAATEAAKAKAEATQTHAKIAANAASIEASGHGHLFADKAQLALKAADDLQAIIKSRIADEKERKAAEGKARQEEVQREAEAAAEKKQDVAAQTLADTVASTTAQSVVAGNATSTTSSPNTPNTIVTCVFAINTPAHTPEQVIMDQIKCKLESAGFSSLTAITAKRINNVER